MIRPRPSNLKYFFLAFVVSVCVMLLFGLNSAFATGAHPPPPVKPSPHRPTKQEIKQYMQQAQEQRQAQRQAQAQAQRQAQEQNATSNASNTASNVAQGGNADANSAGGNVQDSSSFRALALSLPPPVNVPEITRATAACALSESGGSAVGWNFFSQSGAKQTVDAMCLAERQAAAYEQTCKYRTAAAIRYWIAREANSTPEIAAAIAQVSHDDGDPHALTPVVVASAGPVHSLGAFLESAGARPWESETDYSAADCTSSQVRAPAAAVLYAPAPALPVVSTKKPRG